MMVMILQDCSGRLVFRACGEVGGHGGNVEDEYS